MEAYHKWKQHQKTFVASILYMASDDDDCPHHTTPGTAKYALDAGLVWTRSSDVYATNIELTPQGVLVAGLWLVELEMETARYALTLASLYMERLQRIRHK